MVWHKKGGIENQSKYLQFIKVSLATSAIEIGFVKTNRIMIPGLEVQLENIPFVKSDEHFTENNQSY